MGQFEFKRRNPFFNFRIKVNFHAHNNNKLIYTFVNYHLRLHMCTNLSQVKHFFKLDILLQVFVNQN